MCQHSIQKISSITAQFCLKTVVGFFHVSSEDSRGQIIPILTWQSLFSNINSVRNAAVLESSYKLVL